MKKLSTLLLMCFSVIANAQTFSWSGNTAIPANSTPLDIPVVVSGMPSVIDMSFGLALTCIDITHTYDGDLDIKLISPVGTQVTLTSGVGGPGHNYTQTCFKEDGGNGAIINGVAPFTGAYIPIGDLNQCNNSQDPNGTWILRITDTFQFSDTGSVHSFIITFANNPPPTAGSPTVPCSFCVCPGGGATCDLLPDMINSAQTILQQLQESPGSLSVGIATPNIGYGPMEIYGADTCFCDSVIVPCTTTNCPNNGILKHRVMQRIYHRQNNSPDLTYWDRPAGTMSYHPTHGHIHVDEWTSFSIRTSNGNPDATTWPIIALGTKQSFCLVNLGDCQSSPGACVDNGQTILTVPNEGFGVVSGCGLQQGIYPGMMDVYGLGLNDPIDLTGVCNGNYYMVAITDPNNYFLESNENNNWVAVPITLTMQTTQPTADFTINQGGSQIACNGTGIIPGTTFQWNFGDGTYDNVNNPVIHNYSANGTYTVSLNIINTTCGAFLSTSQQVTVTTVSIAENQTINQYFLSAKPNPAKGETEINYYTTQSENVKLDLFTSTGQKIKNLINEYETAGNHSYHLNFTDLNLTNGIYYVRMVSDEKSSTIRLANIK
jgi:hypothetical protein